MDHWYQMSLCSWCLVWICIFSKVLFLVGLVGFHRSQPKFWSQKSPPTYPHVPCMEYLPTFGWFFLLKYGKLVGKYTRPMDPKWVFKWVGDWWNTYPPWESRRITPPNATLEIRALVATFHNPRHFLEMCHSQIPYENQGSLYYQPKDPCTIFWGNAVNLPATFEARRSVTLPLSITMVV